jgi:hypothetical protein
MNKESIDEGFEDFMDWNKSDLLKEFADLNKCDKENVEDYYPDEFNEYCREVYEEQKDIEETDRITINQKDRGLL